MIHCLVSWGDPKSHLLVSKACTFFKCSLWPIEPRKLSFWVWEDGIPTIWYRLRRKMLRSHRIYCTISPCFTNQYPNILLYIFFMKPSWLTDWEGRMHVWSQVHLHDGFEDLSLPIGNNFSIDKSQTLLQYSKKCLVNKLSIVDRLKLSLWHWGRLEKHT